jgi:hypothetical protein
MNRKSFRLTNAVLFLVGIVYISHLLYFGNWKTNIVSEGDASGYYLYLPSILIHKDFRTLDKTMEVKQYYSNRTIKWPSYKKEDGSFVNQYTCGISLLNLVPFSIAHVITKFTAFPADGYSPIYKWSIHIYSILFVMLGLWLLARFLSVYFSDIVVAISLFIIGLGTNLFYMETLNGGMAHGYLFSLHAILIYLSYRFSQKPGLFLALLIGVICGWICLIRPDEVIALMIPLFFFRKNLASILKRPALLITAIFGFFLLLIPQLLYWKAATGDWIHYSYGDQSFDFLHPHLIKGLFSFKNGWLIYTPLMTLSILGLFLGFKKHPVKLLVIWILLLIHIYVIYSWWCWNYINGFGSRPMIEYYAILAFPLAITIERLWKSRFLTIIVSSFMLICVSINIMHTHQMYRGVIFTEDASRGFYLSSFGKFQLDEIDLIANDINQIAPKNLKFVSKLNELSINRQTDSLHTLNKNGLDFIQTGQGIEFSPDINFVYEGPLIKKGEYIKVKSTVFAADYAPSLYEMAKLVLQIKNKEGKLRHWVGIKVQDKLNSENFNIFGGQINFIKEIAFSYRLTKDLFPGQYIQLYIWNPYSSRVYMHDMHLEHWTK